ncbi:MAG: PQQ-binding-like beta-propeller repeat protein, partial [Thermoguttaceae bacterium]|nr:PQQ-binding-like beta-propeller repeat protein [Thermoguttaceae bacterium]
RKPDLDTCPTVVVDESPAFEAVPQVLDAYGWKAKQLLGTARLRHGGTPTRIAFSGAGEGLLSADDEGKVLFWDGQQGTLRRRLEGRLLVADDGTTLVLTSGDGAALIDPAADTPRCRIDQPPRQVLAAGLSADATSLVLVDEGGIGRWDVASGRRLARHELAIDNPDGMPVTASVSRCGQLAALACNRGKVNCVTVFDVGTGRKVLSTVMDYGVAPPLVLCDGGRRLALPAPQLDGHGRLAVFDIDSGAQQFEFATSSSRTPTVVGKNGSPLALVDSGTLVQLDPASGQARRITPFDDDVLGLEFSDDGTVLAVSGYQGTRLVAASTGETLAHRPEPGRISVLSADGTRVLSVDLYGQLLVWNARSGQVQLRAPGFFQPISWLAASGDGRRLAAVSEAGGCRVWAIADGRTLLSLHAPCSEGKRAAQVALSPDGSQVLISTVNGGDPLVWSVQDKGVTTALLEGGIGGGAVAFTPNGRLAVACHHAGEESALRAWDVATGDPVFRDRFFAAGLAVSRDGSDLFALDFRAKRVRRYDWLQKRPMDDFALPAESKGLAC